MSAQPSDSTARARPSPTGAAQLPEPLPVALLGVPVHPLSTAQVLQRIGTMIDSGQPHQVVTANVDFLRLARRDPELQRILLDADLVVGDGMPLVWAARWLGQPLPERVTGADLLVPLLGLAQARGYRVYVLGGTPVVAEQAVAVLRRRHPGVCLAHYAPPYQPLLELDQEAIARRIRSFEPHLLLVAFGCPKAEKWIALQRERLAVPVAIGIGGALDFVAGHHRRAPRWIQRGGGEWLFRLAQEPRRLGTRYARDLGTVGRLAAQALWLRAPAASPGGCCQLQEVGGEPGLLRPWRRVGLPAELTRQSIQRDAAVWAEVLADRGGCLVNARALERVDAAGLGWLLQLRRELQRQGRWLVLVECSARLRRVLDRLGVIRAFALAEDEAAAGRLYFQYAAEPLVWEIAPGVLRWQGEVNARTVARFWEATGRFLADWGLAYGSLVLDLGGVRYLDSAGVLLLRQVRGLARQRRIRLQVRGAPAAVERVLDCAAAEQKAHRSGR